MAEYVEIFLHGFLAGNQFFPVIADLVIVGHLDGTQ